MIEMSRAEGWFAIAASFLFLAANAALLTGMVVKRRSTGQPWLAKRWSVADIWFAIQIILVLLALAMIPIFFAADAAGVTTEEMRTFATRRALLWIALPSIVVQDVLLFAVPAVFVNLKYRLPLRAIGLPRLPRRRDVFAGVVLGLIVMALAGGITAGVEGIAAHFSHVAWVREAMAIDKNNPIAGVQKMLPKFGVDGLLLTVLGAGIAAPFGEEMLFRGFAFNAIKRRFGLWPGIVVSALLFTLPHSYGLGLIPVFLLGMALAWTYHNSGSLWVTILMHATNNTVQVILAFYLPNLVR